MDLAHFFKALIFAGIPISVGQLSYIGALVLTKNMGVITTLSFTTILMGFLISILRYGEKVNLIGVVGSIAIVVGIVFIVK
jgi:drug/metabolite transporter (DMT)-like permease